MLTQCLREQAFLIGDCRFLRLTILTALNKSKSGADSKRKWAWHVALAYCIACEGWGE
jgi:hypothetical protein